MRDKHDRELIGGSQPMSKLRSQIRQVAPTDAKVLITGDSGVGKELVARALHKQSARANHDLVPVNCAGLTDAPRIGCAGVKGSHGAHRDQPGSSNWPITAPSSSTSLAR